MNEPIHLAGAPLGVHRHVCAFFPDLDEEYSVLVPFIAEGLQRGEKAVHAIGPKMRGEHLERLRRGGIDVNQAERTGQLEVRSWEEVQLADGGFDLKRMGDFIEDLLANARSEGYPGTRFITQMEWVLENRPGVEDFLEFEGRLGRMLMRFPDPVICIYDPNSWGGGVVIDVVRSHPMNIVDGVLQEQPFFTYADDLIRELRQRDAEAKSSSKTVRQRDIDSIAPRLLRSGIRDLVGVLLVPATWRSHPAEVVYHNLLEIMTTLVPLEFACARVVSEGAEGSSYICKTGAGRPVIPAESLTRFLETQPDHEASAIANPFGEGTLHVVSWPLGVNARWGTLFAASAAEFLPTDVLLLRGASTQAVLSLDSARSRSREIDQLTLEREKLRAAAELAQLRAHLEPHFLLNTLNAIAGLVTANPSEARNLLVYLGDLLRGLLKDQAELQTLDKQIEWLSWYAQILKIRHAGRLLFRWEIADQARPVLLPRLLLQPLLENAVKHGALKRDTGGEVIVRANVVNVDGAPRLVCTIEDNGPGLAKGEVREGAQGLLAVKRALALYYGEKASLRLDSSPSGTKAIVELPAERSQR